MQESLFPSIGIGWGIAAMIAGGGYQEYIFKQDFEYGNQKITYYSGVVGLYFLTLFAASGKTGVLPELIVLAIVAATGWFIIIAAIATGFVLDSNSFGLVFSVSLQIYMIVYCVALGIRADTFDFDRKLVHGVIYGIPIFSLIAFLVRVLGSLG